jgi:hypothetical protein
MELKGDRMTLEELQRLRPSPHRIPRRIKPYDHASKRFVLAPPILLTRFHSDSRDTL